jgi:preprotein translocase subunit YajC
MRKRQKALQQLVEALKKGDRVITNGGIYGEIQGVDAQTVILKIADNVRIKVAKSAIAGLEAKEGVRRSTSASTSRAACTWSSRSRPRTPCGRRPTPTWSASSSSPATRA